MFDSAVLEKVDGRRLRRGGRKGKREHCIISQSLLLRGQLCTIGYVWEELESLTIELLLADYIAKLTCSTELNFAAPLVFESIEMCRQVDISNMTLVISLLR